MKSTGATMIQSVPKAHLTRKPVGIWIRVSTDDQAKGDSPEHHEHRARCYAESKDWEVVTVYHLEGVSGKAVGEHSETRRMLDDLAEGRISGLIFSKLARLARSTKQLLEFADRFKEAGADLISLQESIDTSTPAGRLFYTMIAAMAQWEREEIASRVAASVPIRAKLGKPLGGAAPFGYQWVDRKLVPHPEEAPIRVKAHELYREHRRKKTTARLLNEAGYRTRRGNPFKDTNINRFLNDPTPKGLYRANYTTQQGKGNWVGLKPEEEWVYTPVEPIMSAELWDECQAIQESVRKTRKKPAKKTVHLFAGFIYCHCGKKMYVPSNRKKYVCAACRNCLPIDDMEHIFIEQLKGFLLSKEDVESYLREADQTLHHREGELAHAQAELHRISQQIDSLFDLYQKGQLPAEGFSDRYQPLHDRQKELEKQTAELEVNLDILKVDTLSSSHILSEGQNLADRWPKLDKEDKRRLVEDLVEEITVGEGEIDIRLLYFPSATSFQEGAKRQRIEWDSEPRPA
jgi:site-specific DNA recombinase